MGKHYSFLRRWLFKKPLYAKFSEVGPDTSVWHYFTRIFGSILFVKLGYEIAIFETKDQNEKLRNSKLVEYETEEQIFDYLYQKDKDGVFMHYYTPGHSIDSKWFHTVDTESSNKNY